MKVNVTKEIEKETILFDLILEGLTEAIKDQNELQEFLSKNWDENKNVILDVKLTINGIEIDVKKFMDLWQDNVIRLVEDKAKSFLSDKFNDIQYKLNDLNERVESEIEQRLEDWEKDLRKGV